jgi:hypothetical protein
MALPFSSHLGSEDPFVAMADQPELLLTLSRVLGALLTRPTTGLTCSHGASSLQAKYIDSSRFAAAALASPWTGSHMLCTPPATIW